MSAQSGQEETLLDLQTQRKNSEGRIYPDPVREPPTPMEASSRFWCGAAVGLLIGLVVGLGWFLAAPALLATVVVLSVLACAGLSVRYGEDFWDWIRDVLWLLRY